MPQAMPMNWLNLYMIFTLTFILINIKMYYNFNSNPKLNTLINKKIKSWKW
uniref:ATP synthase F0 subunit 8 n=1 Tax=Cheilomenes sexmaculata TaxID=158622 RepID=A0A0A0RZG3_9CUCU|nr:ATP synthase F0 subunit 8 [Cheilomenes sexmaculata]QUQ05608.1 ATP synthase F0 subunit 8 [Cheilomenes sexmaculata]QXM14771.1 ATP synthase F0 subunit 8 [Cheilomenes sexmaculata]